MSTPDWLLHLSTAAQAARASGLTTVAVTLADLEAAIGAAELGTGGDALIGRTIEGLVVVDFQKFLKAVYFVPAHAVAFARVLVAKAAEIDPQIPPMDLVAFLREFIDWWEQAGSVWYDDDEGLKAIYADAVALDAALKAPAVQA